VKLDRWFGVVNNFAVGCAAAGILFAGSAPRAAAQAPPVANPAPQAPSETEMPGSHAVHELSRNFEGLVKKVSPAVVEVLVTGYGTADEDDTQDSSPVGRERSLGAGIIVDPDGYIITNYHVVKGSDRVRVQFTPENADESQPFAQLRRRGRVLPAKVIGFSKQIDLAVLKVDATGLPTIPIGSYQNLQKGQIVLAFGSPEGLENSVSFGLVSSVLRQPDPNNPMVYIQTDAAINPGNSGGPLLDSAGNVVGINTAILGPNGGNIGIGFAMPINRAKLMLDDFQAGRKRPKLGASVVWITGDYADALKLPSQGGLLIQDVDSDSAAARAGLRGGRQEVQIGNAQVLIGGDLIMSIDGQPVDREDAISRALARKRSGDTLELTIFRNGRTTNLRVKLGEEGAI
jgi:serine protease Do